jgi:isocitrate/isopropylmalate dehydrogenase
MQNHVIMSKAQNEGISKANVPTLDRLARIHLHSHRADLAVERRLKTTLSAIRDHNERDREESRPERSHALVEFGTRRIVKYAMMSAAERRKRNLTIHDLGMEWTPCNKP